MTAKRILIVEDNPQFASGLSKTLESSEQRYSTCIVHSGEDALQTVGEERPDLVLMDIELAGELNGVETAAQINTQFDVPVVYLTAHSETFMLQQAKAAEPYGYLVKPVQDGELYAAIEVALYKHELDRKLKESEERFRALVQAATDLVAVTGADGIYRYVSPSHERLVGHLPDDLIGKSLFEFLHPEDQQRVADVFTELLFRGQDATTSVEFRFLHQDGAYRWFEATHSNQIDNPAVAGIVHNARDVTERKQAESLTHTQHHLSLALGTARGLDETLCLCLDAAIRVSGMDCGGVYLVDETSGNLDLASHTGLSPDFVTSVLHYDADSANVRLVMGGQPIYTGHQDLGTPLDDLRRREGLRAIAVIPVRHEGRVIACLNVASHTVDTIPDLARVALESMASQIGNAIARSKAEEELRGYRDHLEKLVKERTAELATTNEQLEQEIAERRQAEETLRQRNRDLALLNRANRAFSSTLDLDQVLSTVLEEARHMMDVVACSIWSVEPSSASQGENRGLVCQQATGPQSEVVRGWRLAPGEGIAGWVARTGESVIVPDALDDERHFRGVDRQTGLPLRSILSAPLQVKDRVIGVLQVVDTEVDRFSAADLTLVEPLAASAASAIENARLYKEAARLWAFNENIVQSMAEGIVIEDAAGHITFANPKATELLGYAPEELMGRHWSAFVPLDLLAQAEREAAMRRQGVTGQYESAMLNRENRRVPVIVNARPLFDEDQFTGVLAVFTDITERKRAEEAIKRQHDYFRAVVNSLHDQVLVIDRDYCVTDANDVFLSQVGCARENIIGRHCYEMVRRRSEPCAAPDAPCPAQEIWETGQPDRAIHAHTDPSGTSRWLEVAASPLYDAEGRIAKAIVAYRDVTTERRLEERLAGVHALGQELVLARDERQIAQLVVDTARLLSQSPTCELWLVDEQDRTLAWMPIHGTRPAMPDPLSIDSDEGIIPAVARSGELVYVPDVEKEPCCTDMDLKSRSQLCVPLKVKERIFGVLNIESEGLDTFDEGDLRLFSTLADQAASAIENARLYEHLRRRNEELQALNAIASTLNQAPDPTVAAASAEHGLEQVLNAMLDQVLEVVGLDAGWVQLLDEDGGKLSLVAHRGFPQGMAEKTSASQLGERMNQVIQSGKAIVLDKVSDDPWLNVEAGRREALHAFAGIPIRSRDKMLGVLGGFSRSPRQMSPQELQLLTNICQQVGVAIENARLTQEASEVQVLQELNLLRSELIANVSHELRTPLGLIKILCTYLMMEEVDATIDRESRLESLRGIDEETERLEVIVDNLLDLSQVESGQMRLDKQAADLGQLAREAIHAIEMDTQPTQHRFVHDFPSEPLIATVDAQRIEQVLRNLLYNAVKYSPDGGTITVRGRGDSMQLLIGVSDEGIGIPSSELEKVFERFYRVDNEITRSTRGAGLGLAVCRSIIEAHGGRIWVESALDGGSTFYFSLYISDE